MKQHIKKAVLALFPELAGAYHLAKRAKVLRINDLPTQPETANHLRPRFNCDLIMLDAAGNTTQQELFDVPLALNPLHQLPQPDDIVRVQFDYGNPALPVITNLLSFGKSLPALQQDELLIFKDAQNQIKIKQGQIQMESAHLKTLAKDQTQHAVNLQTSCKHSQKDVSGSDTEQIGGAKTIQAGGVAITSTAGVNIGAISNAQLSSAMELALLAGKKAGIASLQIQIKTPAAEMTIAELGDISIKNKIATFAMDQTGMFEMKNTQKGNLKEILDHILTAISKAVITVGTPIDPIEVAQAKTKLLALFK